MSEEIEGGREVSIEVEEATEASGGFIRYQHVERLNHQECEGLLDGVVHVFFKVDGTNGSIWTTEDKSEIKTGSRNRVLSTDNDNAGFHKWVLDQQNIANFLWYNPNLRLFGEWLVPHSLKTYRDDAWRRFYVFDVLDTAKGELLPYEAYKGLLDTFGIDYIPPLAIIKNPTEEDVYRLLDNSGQFLIEDGKGKGEGLVFKNYDYINKYGRQVWGKIVTNEFKEKNHKEMGAPLINGTQLVEEQIVTKYLTEAFIEKEKSKIIATSSNGFFVNYMIPELLGRVWYEFIREETTEFLKEFKNPKVNFQLLQKMVQRKVKQALGLQG